MKCLYQLVIITAATGTGAVFGRYVLVPLISHLARLMPVSPAHPKHDLSDMVSFFMLTGYNLGLLVGIGMTAAVLCGFLVGVALARRVKDTTRSRELRAV